MGTSVADFIKASGHERRIKGRTHGCHPTAQRHFSPCTAGAVHTWAYDFVEERTHDGRRYRTLDVVDEFTHECLAIRVARKLKSADVIDALSDPFILRGMPEHIRSDNGPEFVAKAVQTWISAVGARTAASRPVHLGKTAMSKASAPASGAGTVAWRIVAMDDMPAHESAGVRSAIEAAGASLRHIPPCSPDFKPIEQVFSTLKALLRKVAARTISELQAAIAEATPPYSRRAWVNRF